MCIQKSIQELCACSHPLFETVKTDRSCDLSVSSGDDYKCVTQLIVEYDIGDRTCECGSSCEETDYEKLISTTIWPGKQSALAFAATYKVHSFRIDFMDIQDLQDPLDYFWLRQQP